MSVVRLRRCQPYSGVRWERERVDCRPNFSFSCGEASFTATVFFYELHSCSSIVVSRLYSNDSGVSIPFLCFFLFWYILLRPTDPKRQLISLAGTCAYIVDANRLGRQTWHSIELKSSIHCPRKGVLVWNLHVRQKTLKVFRTSKQRQKKTTT